MTLTEHPDCTCPWTDPAMWTTYYGATEPGRTREFEPTCPVHGRVEVVRYEADPTDSRGVLIVGQTYQAERREVHRWHTRLFLVGVDSGVGFNDVTFGEVEAAEPSSSSSGVHGRTEQ